ncbi:MAG TPA: NAD(P)/FAD-dependent oxidoreductase, partial [Thermoleophilaceae bacterium]|nr:NAD(P)/FAD-dependent oxidoreductase [Thermoleophilaceae bacterium]
GGMRAVVVGAGLAGLVAADELAQGGAEVVVLEARSRVGGRVWSQRLPNGAVIEMGAEYILPGNTAVLRLAERLGLGIWDKGMRYGTRDPRGGIGTTQEELVAAMATAEAELASGGHADESTEDFLDSIDMPPGAREAILARVEISCANTADRVAAAELGGVAHIDDEPSPSIAGGNQRLALALAEGLGSSVHLDDPVMSIHWDERVRVRSRTGDLDADAAVIAVPASVLDRISFEPALPDSLRDALGSVEYGHAAKLFVPLRAPSPPSAVMNVPERYWTWTATGDEDEPQPVVSAFGGSTPALDALEVDQGPSRWLDSLERLRGDLELDLSGAVLSTWADDPWVRAAYSTSPPPEVAAAVERPTGPLAFAGEHTAGEHAALMEGAIRSGQRAARALLTR